jgi:phosphoadenosine phosphosulfate reductase
MSFKPDLDRLCQKVERQAFPDALAAMVAELPEAVFTTSFSLEDQIILHTIATQSLPVRVVTLDTGRLFEETYELHARSITRYHIAIETYFPQTGAVEALIARQGPNGFYDSVTNRHACCEVRKVEPLGRALQGARLWVTGIRREHSPERQHLMPVEWDEGRDLVKYHPLFSLTWDEALAYAKTHAIPISPLHARGFLSIGCAPCTRAIEPGQPMRAGRWWWENEDKKECGLHLKDGRLRRKGTEP